MKVSVLQENFNRALGIAGRVIPARQAAASSLANVLLTAAPGSLTLLGTDLETSIELTLDAQVDTPGRVAMPHRQLSDMVSTLSRDRLDLELKGSSMHAVCGSSKFTIRSVSAEDFPVATPIINPETILIDSDVLRRAAAVTFAAAKGNQRPVLQGILFDQGPKSLSLVAGDGYRLAEYRVPLDGVPSRRILPGSAISTLQALLGSETFPVLVEIGQNSVGFTLPFGKLTSQVLSGQYPTYQPIFEFVPMLTIEAPRQELYRAVRSAAAMSSSTLHSVSITTEEGYVVLRAASSEVGEYESRVSGVIEGIPTSISCDSVLLSEALNSGTSETAHLDVQGPTRPFTLHLGPDYRVAIMPVVGGDL